MTIFPFVRQMSVVLGDAYSVQKRSCGKSCQLIVAMQMQCDCVLGFPISKSLVVASRPRGLAPNRASSRGRAHNLRLINLLFGSERNVALVD